MLLTENEQKWSNIISEELGVKSHNKIAWMSKMAEVHAIKEGLQPNTVNASQGIYATPLNTLGVGNVMSPQGAGYNATDGSGIGNTGADFHNPAYINGSGDIPMSTLTMALEVAAMTIGFELVPVIPASGPWQMLTYFDTPYAGGKLGALNETAFDGKGPGAENKPVYIKFNADFNFGSPSTKKDFVAGDSVEVASSTATMTASFIGFSRIDNDIIVKVIGCGDDTSIADVFSSDVTVTLSNSTAEATAEGKMRPELVATFADHVQGFSNFFDGSDEPMTRGQNETGTGNTIGARMFSKWIHMGAYEATGNVTRQQLQDMPLYGIDVVGKVLEAMQNEISQAINNRILDRVFKLGVTNAEIQKKYQGVDLNLYFGSGLGADSKELKNFANAKKFINIHNEYSAEKWGRIQSAVDNTSYENITTHQRRIMTRILAAANLIGTVSRRGRGNWVVASSQVVTALQDCSQFVIAPVVNDLVQDGSKSIYFAGSLAGVNVYCDPNMGFDDLRVCVGRKSTEAEPGVVFMPYILCDTVQTVIEGTFAPRLLCNSRFAIADIGFHPEQSYFTFMIDSDSQNAII